MLIIKAYINNIQIDEIQIHNKGEYVPKRGFYEYGLVKPKTSQRFVHKRNKGWRPLAKQVLDYLIQKEE